MVTSPIVKVGETGPNATVSISPLNIAIFLNDKFQLTRNLGSKFPPDYHKQPDIIIKFPTSLP